MNKVKYFIFTIGVFILGMGVTHAASFSVKASSTNLVVGNTVKVTVTVNGTGQSAGSVGAWTYCVNYDSSKLTLVSPASPCVNDGVIGLTSASVVYTFKSKASGSSTVSLSSAVAYDFMTEQPMSTTKGSVTIKARTQAEIEASYSKNADLKNLTVEGYEISPSFDKNHLEYSLEVENEVESVKVSVQKDDSAAHVSGGGEITLTEGVNKVEIVVTAEKGNKKIYVLNITRKELNPIFVTVDGKKLSVVRKPEALEAPNYYTATTTLVNDTEVPAFESDITKYVLVGLKDDNGNIVLYKYENGTFVIYNQIGKEGFTFIPVETQSLIDSYTSMKEIEIDGVLLKSYYKEGNNQDFVIVYGMNASTGLTDWYQYDIVDGTFQRFQSKEIIKLQDDLSDYLLLVIVFASGLGLSIILIISLLVINSNNRKKNIKLMTILENGKVVNKEVVVEDVEEVEEKEEADEELEDESLEDEEEQELESEEDMMARFNRLSDLDRTKGMDKILKEEVRKKELKDAEPLSKRELRRLEKEQAQNKKNDDDSEETVSTFNEVKESLTQVIETRENKKNKTRRSKSRK